MSDQFQVGDIRTIVIGAPGAGNNFSYPVPAGLRLNVHAVTFQFAADANAANRLPCLRVEDPNGGNSFIAVAQAVTIANGSTDYCFAHGNRDMAAVANNYATVPLSRQLILKPGDVLHSDIDNLQVGDAMNEIYVLVESFLLP